VAAADLTARGGEAGGCKNCDEVEVHAYCASFLSSVLAARAMLAQLGPTFLKLNGKIAFHRDVNARNLLVFAPRDATFMSSLAASGADSLEFSIVDFGATMDAVAWTGDGEGSWVSENPTGDARYWGPASWARHLGGPDELRQDASLMHQYVRRLDMFSVAVCSLEALASLHVANPPLLSLRRSPGLGPPALSNGLATSAGSSNVALVGGIERLRASWVAYWDVAVRSFDRLTQYSHCACMGDEWRSTRAWQELQAACISQTLLERLRALCADLACLATLLHRAPPLFSCCTDASLLHWQQAAGTLLALREMLRIDSQAGWQDISNLLSPGRGEESSTDGRPGVAAGADLHYVASNGSGGSAGRGILSTDLDLEGSAERVAGVSDEQSPKPAATPGGDKVVRDWPISSPTVGARSPLAGVSPSSQSSAPGRQVCMKSPMSPLSAATCKVHRESDATADALAACEPAIAASKWAAVARKPWPLPRHPPPFIVEQDEEAEAGAPARLAEFEAKAATEIRAEDVSVDVAEGAVGAKVEVVAEVETDRLEAEEGKPRVIELAGAMMSVAAEAEPNLSRVGLALPPEQRLLAAPAPASALAFVAAPLSTLQAKRALPDEGGIAGVASGVAGAGVVVNHSLASGAAVSGSAALVARRPEGRLNCWAYWITRALSAKDRASS